jgi:hypothetical protein
LDEVARFFSVRHQHAAVGNRKKWRARAMAATSGSMSVTASMASSEDVETRGSATRQLGAVLVKNLKLNARAKAGCMSLFLVPPVAILVACAYAYFLGRLSAVSGDAILDYPERLLPEFARTIAAVQCATKGTSCILGVAPDDIATRALAARVVDAITDPSSGRRPPLAFYPNETLLRRTMESDTD